MAPRATGELSLKRMAKRTVEERLDEHSRKIKLFEDVFVPMAKNANDMLVGKNGQPGWGEEMRLIRVKLEKLLKAYEDSVQETAKIRIDGFDRIKTLENWKMQLETEQADKTGEWRKWIYGIVLFILGVLTKYLP